MGALGFDFRDRKTNPITMLGKAPRDYEWVGIENGTGKLTLLETCKDAQEWEDSGKGFVGIRATRESIKRPEKWNIYLDYSNRRPVPSTVIALGRFSGGDASDEVLEPLLRDLQIL